MAIETIRDWLPWVSTACSFATFLVGLAILALMRRSLWTLEGTVNRQGKRLEKHSDVIGRHGAVIGKVEPIIRRNEAAAENKQDTVRK